MIMFGSFRLRSFFSLLVDAVEPGVFSITCTPLPTPCASVVLPPWFPICSSPIGLRLLLLLLCCCMLLWCRLSFCCTRKRAFCTVMICMSFMIDTHVFTLSLSVSLAKNDGERMDTREQNRDNINTQC